MAVNTIRCLISVFATSYVATLAVTRNRGNDRLLDADLTMYLSVYGMSLLLLTQETVVCSSASCTVQHTAHRSWICRSKSIHLTCQATKRAARHRLHIRGLFRLRAKNSVTTAADRSETHQIRDATHRLCRRHVCLRRTYTHKVGFTFHLTAAWKSGSG